MVDKMKSHIEIEGVILTSEALKELKDMQQHDNDQLNHYRDYMSDCVCFLGSNLYQFPNDKEREEAIGLIEKISLVRDYLKVFKKP